MGVLEQFGILADLDDGEADGKGISREEKIARGIPLDSDDEDDEEEDEDSDGAFDGIDDMPDSDASDVSDDDDESPLSDPDAFDGSDFPEGALSDEEEEDDFAGLDYGDEDVSEEEDDEEDDTLRRITDLDAPGSKAASRRCVSPVALWPGLARRRCGRASVRPPSRAPRARSRRRAAAPPSLARTAR